MKGSAPGGMTQKSSQQPKKWPLPTTNPFMMFVSVVGLLIWMVCIATANQIEDLGRRRRERLWQFTKAAEIEHDRQETERMESQFTT